MNDKKIRISLAEKRKYCDLIKSGANYSQKSLLFSINKFLLGKKVPYISFFWWQLLPKKCLKLVCLKLGQRGIDV